MSWSISVNPAVPREAFDAAVDAIDSSKVTQGKPGPQVGLVEAVEAGKAAMKALAKQVKKPKVGGSASGHCLQPDEWKTCSDSIQASAYGTD